MRYLEMRTVLAVFAGNDTQYSYFVPEGDKPKRGDYILTSTSWAQGSGFEGEDENGATVSKVMSTAKIARVVRVETQPNPRATKFYVHLLSVEALTARKAENAAMASKVEERREAVAKLDKMLAERSKIVEYARLALENPDAKALLDLLES